MSISPGSIVPTDTLVSPLITQLTVVAQQIAGIGMCYPEVPDAPPEDNSVLFAPKAVRVNDDQTNAKLDLHLEIDLIHLFRRKRLQDNLFSIYAVLPAWLTVLTAWSNQTLGGLAQSVNVTQMEIAPYDHGQQRFLALVVTLDIRTLQNINMQ